MLVLATLALLGFAAFAPPITDGDAGEYWLMTESLFRHMSADARSSDVKAIAGHSARANVPMEFAQIMRAYFRGRDGGLYSYHFWGYSLTAVPARGLLALIRGDPLKAHPLTNALVFAFALWLVAYARTLAGAEKVALVGLAVSSPVLWFLRWSHPEMVTFSLVLIALVCFREGRPGLALLAAAVASTQNPPLVWFIALLWSKAMLQVAREGMRARRMLQLTLATTPALIPAAFFSWKFGTPSLIAQGSTNPGNLSLKKTGELFADLNIGMLPYLPIALGLFVLAVGLGIAARRWCGAPATALALALMAYSCTLTGNWNHGTSGPSRYVIWMLPLLFDALIDARARFAALLPRAPRIAGWALALAVASQGAIMIGRGGPLAVPDYLQHSYASAFVLARAPALYNPSSEIFVSRTLHRPVVAESALAEPVVYVAQGLCRKAWASPRDEPKLIDLCGNLPRTGDTQAAAGDVDRWRYVSY